MAVSVLVVEDDKNIADLLQLYLEKEGYAVTLAHDGGEGLEKFPLCSSYAWPSSMLTCGFLSSSDTHADSFCHFEKDNPKGYGSLSCRISTSSIPIDLALILNCS